MLFFLLVVVTFVGCTVYAKPKTAFIFGGNGQIGSGIVEMLLEQGYKITLLNRGSDYYNSKHRIEPRVTLLQCDRFKGLRSYCPEFMHFISSNSHVDVVVDTNAYTTKYMRQSTELFKTISVGIYIFISPDSVYEVCIKRHFGPTKETDTERPQDKAEYKEYANVDKYGHYKLLAEEQLITSGLDYLIFRAPDVIGARDTTSKFWIYHMWVKYFDVLKTPIHLPTQVKKLVTSYVYLDDIVQAVKRALNKGIRNEVFNVAFAEPVTLSTLLLEISRVLETPVQFDHDVEAHKSYHLYPSTGRGQLDITKARTVLGFKPTPFKLAIENTVNYYQTAQTMFPDERYKVVQELINNVASEDTKSTFINMVLSEAMEGRHKYGRHVGHEEL